MRDLYYKINKELLDNTSFCISLNRWLNKVVDCGNPMSNLTLSQQQFAYGSPPSPSTYLKAAIIRCLPGYRWADLSDVKNITCLATAIWSTVTPCVGGRQYIYFFSSETLLDSFTRTKMTSLKLATLPSLN